MGIKELVESAVSAGIPEAEWLKSQAGDPFNPGDFYLSFNLLHRKIREQPVHFSEQETDLWKQAYPGFVPELWDSRTLARCYLVLRVPEDHLDKVLDNLFTTGDISEQESLYRILFLLPDAGRFRMRAAEGIRTNMTRVYDAIALDNPYPAKYFNDGQWNQMVLKAIFMQRPLFRIFGLDERSNPELCRIAQDFAHERWAAGRKVTPELWRLTGKFVNGSIMDDLKRVLESDDVAERSAGILALKDCDSPECRSLFDEKRDQLATATWDELGQQILTEQ